MSKDDEYRRRAAEAQAMADKVVSDTDKAAWLRVAEGWLAMIRQPRRFEQSASDKFDAAEKAQGTNQERSEGEH
jgi:hypothetical protein